MLRTLLDSFEIDLMPGDKPMRQLLRDRARAWLSRRSADRDAICDLANIHPGALDRRLPRLRELWALGDEGRLPPEAVGMRGPRGACFGRGHRRRRES